MLDEGAFRKTAVRETVAFVVVRFFIVNRFAKLFAKYLAARALVRACTHICDSFLTCALRSAPFFAAVVRDSCKMAASAACQQRIALNDGRQMPSFGLGVWQAPLGACKAAVLHALRCGYRHIDTAEIYGNEQDVGDALATF